MKKYLELDSIRGLAALFVVLFHIPGWNDQLYTLIIIRNSDLMVELFFVLSGYVIGRAYMQKIISLKDLLIFQMMRFGRIYPVHIIFFAIFFLLECIKYLYASTTGVLLPNSTPFVENNLIAAIQHILLMQAIWPTGNAITFNFPSWSISVEFYAYLIFGIAELFWNKKGAAIYLIIVLVSSILLESNLYPEYSYLLRCLVGFYTGCLVCNVEDKYAKKIKIKILPLAVICLIGYLYLKRYREYDYLMYLIAAIIILGVTIGEDNFMKKILRVKLLVYLGEISYSVYMSHVMVIWLVNQMIRKILNRPEIISGGRYTPSLTICEAAFAYIAVLVTTILVARIVYFSIERPWREKTRITRINYYAKRNVFNRA